MTMDRPQGYHCGLELQAIILFPSEPQARLEHQKPDHPSTEASLWRNWDANMCGLLIEGFRQRYENDTDQIR